MKQPKKRLVSLNGGHERSASMHTNHSDNARLRRTLRQRYERTLLVCESKLESKLSLEMMNSRSDSKFHTRF
jgi:hypothetical protein